MTQAVTFGPFALDATNALLLRDGARVELTPKAFDLLVLLAQRSGQLVTKNEILDAVWGHRFVSESVVKSVVSNLRSALDDDARAPRWVETVPRRGYRFIGTVPSVSAPSVAAPSVRGRAAELPPSAGANAGALVERPQALATLRRAWQDANAGRHRLVFVSGDPGVGKTTLINEFARTVEHAVLALGQCVEAYGSSEPYLPVLEALNTLCSDAAETVALVRRVAPTWLMQMSWYVSDADRAALQRDVTGASQSRMLREMGVLLEQLTTDTPLVLVIEDLHWSDASTVALLDHLARRRGQARLLIVGTFRPLDVALSAHPIGDLRQELGVHGLCEDVTLEGFSGRQIAQYMAARFDGARPTEALVGALERHTDGLPLFLDAVLDELVEQGVVRREGASWRLPAGGDVKLTVPESLLGLAEKQMSRLPADVRVLLEAGALAMREFDHLALAAGLGREPSAVADALDALVRRKLWLRGRDPVTLPDGRVALRYEFRHNLLRQAFARQLGTRARIELHRRLGATLEAQHGERARDIAGELARHAEEGMEPVRAGRWYAVAAQLAMQRIAPLEALALAERGLALIARRTTPADVELALLSMRIAALMVTQGYSVPTITPSIERAATLIEAQPLSDATVPLWHATWWTLNNGGIWERGRALAARFAELAIGSGQRAAEGAALSLNGMIETFSNRFEAAIPVLRESLAVQRRFGAAERQLPFVQNLEIEALSNLCIALDATARFAEAAAVRAEMERLIEAGVDPLSEAMGLWFMTSAAQMRGDVAAMLALGERAMTLMSTRSALPGAGPHHVAFGWAKAVHGDVAEGLAAVATGIEAYRRQGSVMGLPWHHAAEAEAELLAGNLAAATAAIDAAVALASQTELAYGLSSVYRVHGAILLAGGAGFDAAADSWYRAIDVARSGGGRLFEIAATHDLARGLAATGRRSEGAAKLAAALAPIDAAADCPVVLEARRFLATA